MTALVIEPQAAAELRDAANWYEEQSPGLGDRLLDAVEGALGRSGVSPKPVHLSPSSRWISPYVAARSAVSPFR